MKFSNVLLGIVGLTPTQFRFCFQDLKKSFIFLLLDISQKDFKVSDYSVYIVANPMKIFLTCSRRAMAQLD
ncbi:CLUMA_CG016720, isoform A [Clunio marinus]|uniref:CLUMA_CG016720, isoform A n=1 Tax=Clunio marinus TaxID=568069 RepID=A0A1J1ITL1_9DIPT|nr:CLUMA_CG016720, isoform A [Clunio marinus]